MNLLHRLAPWLLATALVPAAVSAAPLNVLINPGDAGEQSRHTTYAALRNVVNEALREAKAGDANWQMSIDATADLSGTRAQMQDIYVVPAHVAGSALRHGYVPLASVDRPAQAVLATLKGSRITTLDAAAGSRLGLPLQDSIVTYLVRGELNAANTSIKKHFRSVTDSRYQDALLLCLKITACDVVAVERSVFDAWVKAGEPVVSFMQSRPVPGITVAVKQSLAGTPALRQLQPSLLKAFASQPSSAVGLERVTEVQPAAFEYVSTLGYFTPRALPGVQLVDAAAVADLMRTGATYVDTRTEAEFKAGHVTGAKLVPYVEKSAKDADYDASLDSFDLGKLPPDRNAALIFACTGAECWKSFKASQAAVKAGYKKVNWFRGGYPEWRNAGRQVAKVDK
jgi:rhodanese-related sulfurtransferase